MSSLNFLEKLLDGVMVEWTPLGEVTSIKTGQSVNKQMISSNPGEYPVINSGREPLGFIDEWNTDNDPIGLTSRGAGVGSVTWQEGKYFRGNLNYSVTIKSPELISIRYLYHLLHEMQREIQALCTYDGIPALNAGNLKDLLIPVPCPGNQKKSLEIQVEIVRILDAFTELTTELTTRKKQYNHYREQLLSFEDGKVDRLPMGQPTIGEFNRGGGLQKKDFTEKGVGCIHYGQIYTHYGTYADKTKTFVSDDFFKKARKAKTGDLVIATTSENDEDVCKADYNDVRPQFKAIETEQDEKKLSAAENKQALLHPKRIEEISQYILSNFRRKTHRLQPGSKGFNAMFAVSSVDAAKLYYETLKDLQKGTDKPLRVATIFSFAANEEQEAIGDIQDESLEVSALNSSAKEFLTAAIADYNAHFKTSFSVDSNGFQNYYRDLAKQVKAGEIDLLIVVGMFLTGFDAPRLNTLFVDKNLRFHGLIQAFSRTNRIFDATKTFGNIVTFRDLEKATVDAITLFGDKNTKNVVLEKSYKEYMEGFTDVVTGEARRGYVEVVAELEQRFPDPSAIEKEADKKAFAKVFGEYLRIENVLQNFDEFASLRAAQSLDVRDTAAVEALKRSTD